jgi:hypothetical protein
MSLARALLDELDDDDLAELAARLAPFLSRSAPARADPWLPTLEAARHLGIGRSTLQKMTAARTGPPFRQDREGGPCYFRRSDLDAWRIDRDGR